MDGALVVVPLVALVVPIALLVVALVFDVAIVAWAAYRFWHDDAAPRAWRWTTRGVSLHPPRRSLVHR